jgi:hypothetical protein
MAITINGTTGISGVDGSAGTPALQGSDTNTGISFGTDEVNINTGGSTRATVDSSGRVGIGTTSPSTKLQVDGSWVSNYGTLNIAGPDNDLMGVGFRNTSTYLGGVFFRDGTAGDFLELNAQGSRAIRALTNGTERARIDSSGNFKFDSGYGSVATAYGCRAWVNFNGTGTVAIRASGNVSSITDNGTADYTANLTTAMPDANFCWTATAENQGPGNRLFAALNAPNTTSSLRVTTYNDGGTQKDSAHVFIAVFR